MKVLDLAVALVSAAEVVIAARRPLIERTASGDGKLQIVVHRWGGAKARWEWLARLNPGVTGRGFVRAGRLVSAYAQ